MRYAEDDDDEAVAFDEIDLDGDDLPGEFEIDLSVNNEEDHSDLDSERYSLDRSRSNMNNSTHLSQSLN